MGWGASGLRGGGRYLRGQSPLRANGPSVNPPGQNPTERQAPAYAASPTEGIGWMIVLAERMSTHVYIMSCLVYSAP